MTEVSHNSDSTSSVESENESDESDGSTEVEVLIVEDDINLAELYAAWLGDICNTRVAHDGYDGWEQFDEAVDVVLLDRVMPRMSGDELLRRIRDADVDCQVVMVSAVQPGVDIVRMGFDAYVQKPTTETELKQTIDRMQTRATYDEQLRELFSLMERQSTLEASTDPKVLEESSEYAALTEQLAQVQESVEMLLTSLPDEDFRAAVERMQRTKTEREERRRNESLTNDVMDTSREGTVVVDADGEIVWANSAVETLLGVPPASLVGHMYAEAAPDVYRGITATEGPLGDLVQQVLASDMEHTTAVTVPSDGNSTLRQLEYWSAPIKTGLYAGGRIEHFHDITRQHEREQTLHTLQRATHWLVTATTAAAITREIVDTATEDLEFSTAALFRWDETTGELSPVAAAGAIDDPTQLPTVTDGTGPLWSTFTEQQTTHSQQYSTGDTPQPEWLASLGTWMLCPLERRGVLLVGFDEQPSSYEFDVDLAEMWAANAERSLTRLQQDNALRQRDRRLEWQNSRLERLDRINRLIRSISKVVVGAETREGIERDVCRQIAGIDRFPFVWIADWPVERTSLETKAVAGDGGGYLDGLTGQPDPAETGEINTNTRLPAAQSIQKTAPVVIEDVLSVSTETWWRGEALSLGHHAILAVPLVHGETIHGALEIHSASPQGFDDDEVNAFAELGQTIGHGISSVHQRESLLAGGGVELEFEVTTKSSTITDIASTLGDNITIQNVTPIRGGGYAAFISVPTESDDHDTGILGDALADRTDVSVVQTNPASTVLRVSIDAESVLTPFIEYGGALERLEYRSGGDQRVIVTVDRGVDIRRYVEAINDSSPTTRFVARRERGDTTSGFIDTVQAVDKTLTKRQREVAQTAFYAGYFEWPREADSSTVADTIGIAQSTFQQHLRSAEKKILTVLFGGK
ncbi:bacterio-opsin activator domain-containing protein [Halalkalirubrum salinum]|uniref:bacterio-opsin activator domain-containing protein n=1 Tax=Halalkalirubrum salinum TaxID=2563889 RepID=UPI0010FB332C|nr:bacterio-opsin activator domain-containing protein [Halalkalirubrum salinum]